MGDKWKKYAVLLLAGIVSMGTGKHGGAAAITMAVNAAVVDGGTNSDNTTGNTQTDDTQAERAAGTGSADSSMQTDDAGGSGQTGSADGSGQADGADGSGQTGSADGTDGSGQADGADGSGQSDGAGLDADGEDLSQDESGAGAGSGTDKPQVSAGIHETNPEISAGITEVSPDEADDHVVITKQDKPYLALGANLNEQQKHAVLSLMGIDPANLDQYQVVTVTNEEEHQYLDGYLDASVIGTRALSSVVIVKRDKGDGIHISTKNITYCTIGMYKNALATAGLEDADVIIAGPFPLSGTAALIGAMKAYADMENEDVDPESLDAAMNEIVVTGELNESLGDDVQTEEFIAYVKQKVVEGGLESKEKIQKVISEACDKFEITLNDEEKAQVTSLMEKIGSLDIDVDSLLKQAGSIYDSLKEMEKNSGFLSSIAAFFKRLLEAIVAFFKNLF